MSDSCWLETGAMRELVMQLVEKATHDYRVEPDIAEKVVVETLLQNTSLRGVAQREQEASRIARTRVFKNAASTARRQIYYSLRRYRDEDGQCEEHVARLAALPDDAPRDVRESVVRSVLLGHASTRERLDSLPSFYSQLRNLAGEVETMLDVGCGVHPLTFPFDDWKPPVRQYFAVDKDRLAVDAVEAYGRIRRDGCLRSLRWEMASGWEPIQTTSGMEEFDLALLLKVVPVIKRQAPALLEILGAIPARRILVTGSRTSMAKQRSIERRERAVLRAFLERGNLTALGEFRTEDEIGWLVSREL